MADSSISKTNHVARQYEVCLPASELLCRVPKVLCIVAMSNTSLSGGDAKWSGSLGKSRILKVQILNGMEPGTTLCRSPRKHPLNIYNVIFFTLTVILAD